MELNWNKTPDGRRFIHTAQIVPGFEWCITQGADVYELYIEGHAISGSVYDTLKQAKAAAKRMTMDRTWTCLAGDEQAALIALHGTQEIVDMYAANEKADMFGDVNAAPKMGMLNDVESFKVGVFSVLAASDIDFSGPPKAIDGQHLHARIVTLGSMMRTNLGSGPVVEDVTPMPHSDHSRVTVKLSEPDAEFNTHAVKVVHDDVAYALVSGPVPPVRPVPGSVGWILRNGTYGKLGDVKGTLMPNGSVGFTGAAPRSIGEVLMEVENAAQTLRDKSGMSHITAVCGPTVSDLIRKGHLQPFTIPAPPWNVRFVTLDQMRAWAWPRAGQFVEYDIKCRMGIAAIKRTHAKQTGNARVLVSRNKREGRYAKPYWSDSAFGYMRYGDGHGSNWIDKPNKLAKDGAA